MKRLLTRMQCRRLARYWPRAKILFHRTAVFKNRPRQTQVLTIMQIPYYSSRRIDQIESLLVQRSGKLAFVVIGSILVAGIVFVLLIVAVIAFGRRHYQSEENVFITKKNLEFIGEAFPNYHDTFENPRPAVSSFSFNTQQHSWMTGLLPFVEQDNVYDMLDLNKPWDNEANQAGFENNIVSYVNYSVEPQPWKVGTLGAAHFAANSQAIRQIPGRGLPEIPHGTSNLIIAGEVASGFKAWGDPSNLRDPSDGLGNGSNQFGSVPGKKEGAMLLSTSA